jgi:hypothetical protein
MSDEPRTPQVVYAKACVDQLYREIKIFQDALRLNQGDAWSHSRADRLMNVNILLQDAQQLLHGFDHIGEHPDAVAVRELTERMLRERLRLLVKEESQTEGATLTEIVIQRVTALSDGMDAAMRWLPYWAKRDVLRELRDNIIVSKLDEIEFEELKRKPRPPGAGTEKA